MRGGGTMRRTGQGRKSLRRRNRGYGHTHIRLKYSAPSFNLQVVFMVVKEYFDVVFCSFHTFIFSCFYFSQFSHSVSFIFLSLATPFHLFFSVKPLRFIYFSQFIHSVSFIFLSIFIMRPQLFYKLLWKL